MPSSSSGAEPRRGGGSTVGAPLPYHPSVPCAECARGTDPLRAACVGATETRVFYFCSRGCRDAFTARETSRASARDVERTARPRPNRPSAAPVASAPPPRRAPDEAVSRRVPAVPDTRLGIWVPVLAAAIGAAGLSPIPHAPTLAALALLAVALGVTSQATRTRRAAGPLAWLTPALTVALLAGVVVRTGAEAPLLAALVAVIIAFFRERHLAHQAALRTAAHEERVARLARQVSVSVPALDGSGEQAQVRPARGVRTGDVLIVSAGDVLPVDGVVQRGEARVSPYADARAEQVVRAGDTLVAGARVREGVVRLEATRTGADCALLGPLAPPGDEVASTLSLGRTRALAVGLGLGVPLAALALLAEPSLATRLSALAAALVIAPLFPLAVAITACVQAARAEASARGVRFRDLAAVEALGRVDVVAVRVEGVLADEAFQLREVRALSAEYDARALIGLALAAEQAVPAHPLARALAAHEGARAAPLVALRRAQVERGRGLTALTESGAALVLGNREALLTAGVSVAVADALARDVERTGATVVFLAVGGHVRGLFVFARKLLPEARPAVRALAALGVEVLLLSSDQRTTVEAIAGVLGAGEPKGALDAAARADEVRRLRDGDLRIVAVARQPRDEPLLAAADVGLSVGGAGRASHHAVATAGPDLDDVVIALTVARRARLAVRTASGLIGAAAIAALFAAAGLLPPLPAALFALVVEVGCLGLLPRHAGSTPARQQA